MKIQNVTGLLILLTILLTACGSPTATQTSTPTINQVTYLPTVVTPISEATPTLEGTLETATQTATTESVSGALPDISSTVYLDDRSTAAALMLSYFNAINRREYLRAYSYYEDNADIGTLDEFSEGYAETALVSVVAGPITDGGAAGSIYFTVPMILNATTTTGVQQKFAACYVLRLPQPGNYAAPPINPMHIERGTATAIPLSSPDADALALACPAPDFPTDPNALTPSMENLDDLSRANYIDNRSDAEAVIRSYVNAINRREFVRAYTYWQETPGSYEDFSAYYANIEDMTAQFGTALSEAGAGQLYYSLPVAMRATQTDGSVKTFAGCYLLHMSQAGIQATPPFQPLGIISANVATADNTADLDSLLTGACE